MTRFDINNLKPKIIAWASQMLTSQGYVLTSAQPEEVRITPFSYVAYFNTSFGKVYLKATPENLGLEAEISDLLRQQFYAAAPIIIASEVKYHVFLMQDAGTPLRNILKQHFNVDLLCNALNEFISLQVAAANNLKVFFDIGVPDWRLHKLPDLYQQLLTREDLLVSDGCTKSEIKNFSACLELVSSCCQQLADYSIGDSIVQPDFHDNNILFDENTKKLTFIDLGECVISHPLFSLLGCLWQAKRHHHLLQQGGDYQRLLATCHKHFSTTHSEEIITTAFALASKLWHLFDALSQCRLWDACDHAQMKLFQRQGRLRTALLKLIDESVHGFRII